ncbi:hypothetical protein MML48_2g00015863 [Holotrichia oblita]|uniref:Uncharacterized protein n=1 Tax=Holotrichia oblita TaxID=644536 RepID=A0ACB9TPI6_HOLOL|nr:hypothetical protein MML48_2g00015863 [Holotrichia oblita]
MKYLKLVLLLVLFASFCEALGDDCAEIEDSGIEECEETEYTSYIECVRRRTKRHAGCSQSCDSCNCNTCSGSECSSHCNVCCANFEQPCQTKYCCYKTCHSQCSHQGCRDTCRRTCTDKLEGKETIVHQIHTGSSVHAPNITTIINLHNKINNTNIIDVPINLRTDNINNITINTSELGSNGTSSGGQRCCQVVSPRQCTPTREFPFMRCYHLRKRVCGNICQANIMHAQPHQVCDQRDVGPPDCHNQVIYIPQPQPRCAYKAEWPYVSCNIPTSNCEGCYEHYVTNSQKPTNCPSSCYDEGGYGVGPFIPQGPVYRPFGSTPNCMQMGTCPPYYGAGAGTGLGGYGFSSGGGYDPIPLSGIGYQPSAYENNFVVQQDMEVPDLSKLFSNLTQNDDYDAQTLPITNSITQPPSTLIEPRLVKIETVNATDVFMTIKEMNDEGSLEDDDVTTLPTATMSGSSAPGSAGYNIPMYPPQSGINPNPLQPGISPYAASLDPTVRHLRDDKMVSNNAEIIDVMMADEGKTETASTKTTTTTTNTSKSPKILVSKNHSSIL